MKIFSLQSKLGLIGWSLILGLIIEEIIFRTTYRFFPPEAGIAYIPEHIPVYAIPPFQAGSWPILRGSNFFATEHLINGIFWILIVVVFLSLFKYLKARH